MDRSRGSHARFGLAAGAMLLVMRMSALGADSAPAIRPLEGSQETSFPDGSTGRISKIRGCEGTYLPAYVRKPKGDGPFPVVVMLHGGATSKEATYRFGSTTTPTPAFVAAGWAVVSIDFRPTAVPLTNSAGAVVFPPHPPIETNDTVAAIAAVRTLPSIDGKRVAVMGGSHGGYVMARVASRADLSCAIICAPAILDTIELSRAMEQKVDMIQVIKNKVAEAEQKYGAPMSEIARHPAEYGYESPLTEAANVRCPILIINGQNDRASPLGAVQAYIDRLHAAGKEAESYFPENGPHGFYFASPKPIPETEEAARRAVAFIRKQFQQ
jgi:dipeptidyl aminopeptidase/acylaminoacyl peptidase